MRLLAFIICSFIGHIAVADQIGIGTQFTGGSTLYLPYKIDQDSVLESSFHYSTDKYSEDSRYTRARAGISYLIFKPTSDTKLKHYFGPGVFLRYQEGSNQFALDEKSLSFGPIIGIEYDLIENLSISIEANFYLSYGESNEEDSFWESDMGSTTKIRYYF